MPATRMPRMASLRLSIMATAALALGGCISFGEDPPPALLTLTPSVQIAEGAGPGGEASGVLTVRQPEVPGSLSVTRVPVQVDPSTIAYLKDAVWVDRPSKLFQNLLVTTIRENGGKLQTRRFTARVPGVPAEASPVGVALNDAANQVAIDVADWIGR